jgi:hypothetical protein
MFSLRAKLFNHKQQPLARLENTYKYQFYVFLTTIITRNFSRGLR